MKTRTLQIIALLALVSIAIAANAEGTNVLKPLIADTDATIKGSKWILYAAEAVAACVGYIMTRKWTIFGGIAFLMVYANAMLVTGVTP